MECKKDILNILPSEDLPILRNFYKDLSYAPYVFSFLDTAMKWNSRRPDKQYISIYVPDNWKVDGTFIALLQWSCYDFFIFTKEENYNNLYKILTETKSFEWNKRSILFYAVHQKHFPTVYKALQSISAPVSSGNKYDIWWMPQETAKNLQIVCPPEVYLGKVTTTHVPFINSLWPNRYLGSLEYLTTFVKMNGASGLFLKSDNSLVSWIFKVHLGTMAILQTIEEHKGKGYGGIVTKAMAKEIAEDGHDPLGTVLVTNESSQKMFKKIGFEILDQVYYISIHK